MVELFRRRSPLGLVGTQIDVRTGLWVNHTSHIGGMIDSYYEYLVKAWKLFGDEDCRRMWEEHARALTRYVADTAYGGLWYGEAEMESGKRTGTAFGSLEAFFPAVLVLAGDVPLAAELQASCFRMWNRYGIEPEAIDYTTMCATDSSYHLRPEIIESAYYLYEQTGDDRYREMGRVIFDGLRRSCRTPQGYAMIEDVRTKRQGDRMESFFFAETLKYLYLLFAPPATLPFGSVIFNTEAHPLRRTWTTAPR
jgi:mannosidase alpha-like ER degradation enhancer 2